MHKSLLPTVNFIKGFVEFIAKYWQYIIIFSMSLGLLYYDVELDRHKAVYDIMVAACETQNVKN